jgi:hypothetical protein
MVDQATGLGDLSVPPPLRGRHRSGTGVFDAVLIAGGLAFTASLALSFIDGRYPNLNAERRIIGPYTDSPGLFQSATVGDENAILRWHLRTAMDPVALAQVLFDAVSGGPAPYVAEFLSFFQHEAAEFMGLAAASIPNFDSSAQLVDLGVAIERASGALTFRPGGGGGWSGAGTAVPWLFQWPAWLPLPPWLQLPPWVIAPSAPLALSAQLLPAALPPAPAPVLLEIAVPSFVAPPQAPPPAPLPPAPELLPPPPPPPPAPLPPPPPEPVQVIEPVPALSEPIVVEAPPDPEPVPVEVVFSPSEPVASNEPPSSPDVQEPSHVFDSGILGSGSQIGPYGTDKPIEPSTGSADNPSEPTGPVDGGEVADPPNAASSVGGGEEPSAGNAEGTSNAAGDSDSNGDGGSPAGDTNPSP